jgi:DNA mismatch repair protein MutS2
VKYADLLDPTTASALQIAWLDAAIEPVSEMGRRAAAELRPYPPGEEAAAQSRAEHVAATSAQFYAERVHAMRDALRTSPDPLPAVSRATMGDVLEDAHLLELLRFFDALARIDALTGEALAPFVNEAVRPIADLLETGRAGKFGFYLSDDLDPQLAAFRAHAERAQAEYDSARGRLAQRVASALGRDEISGGEFIVMRDAISELPPSVRIVREAPTYYLCELELDESALDALRRRDTAVQAVASAEEAVRARVSAAIRERGAALDALIARAGEFDVLLAHAHFTQQYSCVPAQISERAELVFTEARYLPLAEQLETQGRAYEPISIELSDVGVLTGPNMGGKSVALRTCGFIAALAAFGLPVPASQARTALFDEIAWVGIGGQEELGGLLSSFAREVVRLKDVLARPAQRALLLIDEFARTTTPHEGKALLVGVVRGLRRRKRLAFIATHLAGIAAAAGVRHFAVRGLREVPKTPPGGDLDAALAALAESMDYAVVEVADGAERQADAVALAQLLGLDDDVVQEAKQALWIP